LLITRSCPGSDAGDFPCWYPSHESHLLIHSILCVDIRADELFDAG
jgi:hypothetical protein